MLPIYEDQFLRVFDLNCHSRLKTRTAEHGGTSRWKGALASFLGILATSSHHLGHVGEEIAEQFNEGKPDT